MRAALPRRKNLASRRACDIVWHGSSRRVRIQGPQPGDRQLSASPPFELEIKLALPDEAAWRAVRSLLAATGVVHQANHFFDTRDRALEQARIGVRLRKTDAATRLTVKSEPTTEPAREAATDAMLTRRIELEASIAPPDFDRAIRAGLDLTPWLDVWRAGPSGRNPDVAALVEFLAGVGRLETFGAFTNERTTGGLDLADAEAPIEVELDCTTFPGERVEYELEIELDADTKPREVERIRIAVLDRLAALGIRPAAAPSKLARFRAALDRGSR